MKTALTIAGSDSSGGAGIQGDLKTFAAHGVHGMSAITAVTAQNTRCVSYIQGLDSLTVESQIQAVLEDIRVDSIKIGMLYNRPIVQAVVTALKDVVNIPIVLDPVMVSTTGRVLLKGDAITLMVEKLFPLCTLVTPNIHEAELLTGLAISSIKDMEEACKKILRKGPTHVLLKGGHLQDTATDVLYDGSTFSYFAHERIDNCHTHGTGCALSSAIAANWSRGLDTKEAVQRAKDYISRAIAGGFAIGAGDGPILHFTRGSFE